jgi:hypothetical protein
MRIKVLQRPTLVAVDGLQLDRFEPGYLYDVGTALGCLFLCEGWAEPVATEEPALLVPLSETKPAHAAATPSSDHGEPSNLLKEIYPPYLDSFAPRALAAHRERRRRRPSRKR